MRKITLIVLALMLVMTASCAKKAKVQPGSTLGAYDLDDAFKRANALIDRKQYDAARRELELIKGRDTEMKYAPLAHLRVADTYILQKEYDPAIDEYRKFIEFYPDHKYASYAQFQIGIIYFDQIEDAERGADAARRALEEFEKLNQLYPRNPYRETLVYYIDTCRDILSEHGFVVAYLEVLDEFPDFKKKDETYYKLALSYAHMGEPEKAKRYLELLKTEYPDSKLVKDAEKEISKASRKKS
jgi:outer membrane protein assembly factor BamD